MLSMSNFCVAQAPVKKQKTKKQNIFIAVGSKSRLMLSLYVFSEKSSLTKRKHQKISPTWKCPKMQFLERLFETGDKNRVQCKMSNHTHH